VGTEVTGVDTGGGDEDVGGLEGVEDVGEAGADDEATAAGCFARARRFDLDACVRLGWSARFDLRLGLGVGFSECPTRVADKCAACDVRAGDPMSVVQK
jgi:hypothetical protein